MWQMPHVITIRENNIKCITRFNQSEMKRLYRIFKSECPSGLITEEVFHNIFSKFFPLGAESYNGKRSEINEIHPEFIIFIIEWVNIAIAIHCIDCIAALNFVFYRNPPTVRGLLLLMSAIQYISDLWSAYSIFQFIWSLLISSKRELLLPLCFLSTSAGWLWSHYVWGKLCLRNKISNFPQQCIEGVLEQVGSSDTFSRILLWVSQSSWTGLRRRSWSGHSTFTTWTGTESSPGRRWRTSPCRSVAVKFFMMRALCLNGISYQISRF